MKSGLLGGSFNPIHCGHLIVATCVAERLGLDRVLFVPTAVTPLKHERDLASPADRLEMVRRAVRDNRLFEACDLEIRRRGVSYTVDTLRELERRTGADLFLILGADAFRLLSRWKSIGEIRRRVTFVCATRPGHRPRRRMPKQHIVDVPLLEISGTEIRRRVRQGLSIRYLVPDAVERYIQRKGLYR